MPPGHEERASEPERQTGANQSLGGAGADAEREGSAGPQCRVLTPREAARALARAARGETLAEDERHNLTQYLQTVPNDTFTQVIRLLDQLGLLQSAMQEIFGTQAEQGRGDNQYEVPVLCYRFWNAANNIDADVRRSNTIYNPLGVFIRKTADRTITKAETEQVVGRTVDDDFRLDRTYEENDEGHNRYTHADMSAVVRRYVPTTVIGGLWAKRIINESGADLAGTSSRAASFGPNYSRLAAVATDHSGADTFAHELGHVLTNEGHHTGDADNLMTSGGTRHKDNVDPDRLTATQVSAIRASTLGWVRRAGS